MSKQAIIDKIHGDLGGHRIFTANDGLTPNTRDVITFAFDRLVFDGADNGQVRNEIKARYKISMTSASRIVQMIRNEVSGNDD
jgi:hypothetical protein